MYRRKITPRQRYETLHRSNFACFYCASPVAEGPLVIDHVIPVAMGGANDPWNLVAACPDCNAGKSASLPTHQIINRARGNWLAAGDHRDFAVCEVCGVPFRSDPGDIDEEHPQCESCNAAICAAFDAGVTWARRNL